MEKVEMWLPNSLFDILQENADAAGLTVDEYAAYLIKKLLTDGKHINS